MKKYIKHIVFSSLLATTSLGLPTAASGMEDVDLKPLGGSKFLSAVKKTAELFNAQMDPSDIKKTLIAGNLFTNDQIKNAILYIEESAKFADALEQVSALRETGMIVEDIRKALAQDEYFPKLQIEKALMRALIEENATINSAIETAKLWQNDLDVPVMLKEGYGFSQRIIDIALARLAQETRQPAVASSSASVAQADPKGKGKVVPAAVEDRNFSAALDLSKSYKGTGMSLDDIRTVMLSDENYSAEVIDAALAQLEEKPAAASSSNAAVSLVNDATEQNRQTVTVTFRDSPLELCAYETLANGDCGLIAIQTPREKALEIVKKLQREKSTAVKGEIFTKALGYTELGTSHESVSAETLTLVGYADGKNVYIWQEYAPGQMLLVNEDLIKVLTVQGAKDVHVIDREGHFELAIPKTDLAARAIARAREDKTRLAQAVFNQSYGIDNARCQAALKTLFDEAK